MSWKCKERRLHQAAIGKVGVSLVAALTVIASLLFSSQAHSWEPEEDPQKQCNTWAGYHYHTQIGCHSHPVAEVKVTAVPKRQSSTTTNAGGSDGGISGTSGNKPINRNVKEPTGCPAGWDVCHVEEVVDKDGNISFAFYRKSLPERQKEWKPPPTATPRPTPTPTPVPPTPYAVSDHDA